LRPTVAISLLTFSTMAVVDLRDVLRRSTARSRSAPRDHLHVWTAFWLFS
jgi:hypothetical protein